MYDFRIRGVGFFLYELFFWNKTRKILVWQKIQPSLGLHPRGTQNKKIKNLNKTHMNIKAHKSEIYTNVWPEGRGRGGEGASN